MFRRHRTSRKLGAILLAALAVRLAFAAVYVHSHDARALGTISFLFEPGNIAWSLYNGNGFASPFRVETGPTAWMTPIYPLLLASLFKLFGPYTFNGFLAAAGLNIAFSAFTCVPVYFTTRRIGGERAAAAASLLWAAFPTAILLPYESMWDASLAALLAAALLWATLWVADSARARDWCLYGLLWGVALMTTATLISTLPFLLGWAGYRARAKPLLAAVVILLCCAPWTIRNYRVFHSFIPLRTVGGLALWLGNTPEHRHPISNQAEREQYMALGEVAYMREKQRDAIGFIAAHPGAELAGCVQRFLAFWNGGTTNFGGPKSARFYWVIGFNIFAALGAFAGVLALIKRRSPYVLPLAVFPVIFPLVYYFSLSPPRYRHPADPALLILTAVAITRSQRREQSAKL